MIIFGSNSLWSDGLGYNACLSSVGIAAPHGEAKVQQWTVQQLTGSSVSVVSVLNTEYKLCNFKNVWFKFAQI